MQRDQFTGLQLADDHAENIHRTAPVVQPGADFGEFFTGQVHDSVEHVRAAVEQEAAAGDLRYLTPRAGSQIAPVLPDGRFNGEDLAQITATQHVDGGAHIGGHTAVKGHHQQLAGAVTGFDQFDRFFGVHHHRFFQQHVQPGFQTGSGLGVVHVMRRDDEGNVKFAAIINQQFLKIGFVGGRFQTGLTEKFGSGVISRFRGFANHANMGGIGLFEHTANVMPRHAARSNHRNLYRGC